MGGIADPEALAAEAAPRPGGPQALPAKAGSRPGTPVPGAQRSVRARPPSFFPPPQRPPRRRSRSAARRIAGTPNRSTHPTGDPRPPSPARSEASAPVPSSPVPPPQRPPRRRSRSAARRIAGTLSRSRQPTGDPRPPSQRPRKSPGRGQSPFLVSAPGGKNSNHFSLRCVRDEKSLSRSDAQNAVQSPSGSAGRALAIAPPPKGRRRGAPGKRRRTPPLPGLSSAKRLRRFTDDSHARYDPRTPGRPGRRRSRRCGRC